MTISNQRVNYDQIADLYDEPGRDYDTDPNLIEFINHTAEGRYPHFRVLDMGCGTGKQLAANHARLPNLQAVGLDLFRGMLLQAQKRCAYINWVQGDSSKPPFAENTFDYITNQFSYHHVQDKKGMVESVFRILKPGGRFVITNLDPWSMPEWILYRYFPAARQRDLVDFLPVDQITALMQITGFCNIFVKYKHSQSQEQLSVFLKYASQRHRTSQLIVIPDAEYREGVLTLKEDVKLLGKNSHISSEICLVWISGDKPG